MFSKILIANRGEIACRVIATAKRLGIATVAVYSDADRDAKHTSLADEAYYLGPAAASESYLRGEAILDIAQRSGAQAIHPGYGFLSENADFCRRCDDAGVVFIGPPVAAIEAMGSKSAAKRIMAEAAVPLLPGYHGDDQDDAILKAAADDIGYPVLLKASAGGGGKGMRIIWNTEEFDSALAATRREARNAFGDDKMLVEKYLTGPRHVELQVFCDQHGNAVHLFERDCSLQRRHQKVIEEAPAPGMSETLRQAMGDAALQAARAIGYQGAGTVEFLLGDDGGFYFMEMNTRLQVEHPVTEMISGQDLVEWQLLVASGSPLPCAQSDLQIRGHAFEARLYAEDAEQGFLPQTGRLNHLQFPEESNAIRVDSGVRSGDSISMYYDPMIAKLIAWDEDRDRALRRLQGALAKCQIDGLTTNRDFLLQLASHPTFAASDFDTGFIDKHYEQMKADAEQRRAQQQQEHAALAALHCLLSEQAQTATVATPWRADNWRLNLPKARVLSLDINGQPIDIRARAQDGAWQFHIGDRSLAASGELRETRLSAELGGRRLSANSVSDGDKQVLFLEDGSTLRYQLRRYQSGEQEQHGGLLAPMNGRIVSLLVKPQQTVKKGEVLLIMEAMKMEHSVTAPADGSVMQFHFAEGELVEGGAALLAFEEASA
ncbi:acetyl/propionyl/methylcrotonyl-CoA carboxylase subunit alpha [Spongiibacter tropicus]|uniref:acetyl/propionyl/methylcrotonyl-CoA carboxylase subunit alpha n=1 Tax=Spongiibacter tropicus TaxID=454602 RepID=UPI0003B5EB38|nr:acetyl/propionyl/methylcrotonyl-CoA carboxylase subunit alpha [Spongiibacter tropicus]